MIESHTGLKNRINGSEMNLLEIYGSGFYSKNVFILVMKNRMAVRCILLAKMLQLPATWTSNDGMVHIDVRFFGPLAGFLAREGHSFWREAQVSFL